MIRYRRNLHKDVWYTSYQFFCACDIIPASVYPFSTGCYWPSIVCYCGHCKLQQMDAWPRTLAWWCNQGRVDIMCSSSRVDLMRGAGEPGLVTLWSHNSIVTPWSHRQRTESPGWDITSWERRPDTWTPHIHEWRIITHTMNNGNSSHKRWYFYLVCINGGMVSLLDHLLSTAVVEESANTKPQTEKRLKRIEASNLIINLPSIYYKMVPLVDRY